MSKDKALEAAQRIQTWEQLLAQTLEDTDPQPALGWQIRCYNRAESTMLSAREFLPELGVGQAALVLAAQQAAGRGRMGRSWAAAQEGFFGTFVFCERFELSRLSGFSLVVGSALHQVFLELGVNTYLKWPNDVLSQDGRKLCGILLEVLPGEDFGFVLVGIGINLQGAPRQIAHSVDLKELCGKSVAALDIATHLAPRLLRAWQRFMQQGFPAFRDSWCQLAFKLGAEIEVNRGDQALRGKFVGVNEYGNLLLETDQGLEKLSSGEVIC